jgi:hypothetical protein
MFVTVTNKAGETFGVSVMRWIERRDRYRKEELASLISKYLIQPHHLISHVFERFTGSRGKIRFR